MPPCKDEKSLWVVTSSAGLGKSEAFFEQPCRVNENASAESNNPALAFSRARFISVWLESGKKASNAGQIYLKLVCKAKLI